MLRTGEPAAWASADEEDWELRLEDVGFARRITAAMDARGAFLGPALAAALADIPARRVLDVGGGSGVYACALVDRHPQLRATVFERAPVDRAARALLAERGYSDRVDVTTGDMFADSLPAAHDLHLLSHVLRDWGERSQCSTRLSRRNPRGPREPLSEGGNEEVSRNPHRQRWSARTA